MSSKIFASQGDFSSRVTETLVFLNGEVFYARPSPKTAFHLDLYDFPSLGKVIHTVHVDAEPLYIGAARLGLFNNNGGVFNPLRTPARRYRYGTPPEYLSFRGMTPDSRGTDAFNNGFKAMLLNQYPTVEEAMEVIKKSGGKAAVAISRHFWVKENQIGMIQLHFKDQGPILWVAPSGVITFVEKTTLSKYLTQCSRSLNKIIEELQKHAV